MKVSNKWSGKFFPVVTGEGEDLFCRHFGNSTLIPLSILLRDIASRIFLGVLLILGLTACAHYSKRDNDSYYVPSVQKYVSSIPEYQFKDPKDVLQISSRIKGRVMVFFRISENSAFLVPRGLFCAHGTPPFVTVDYYAANAEKEREILNSIVNYNRNLLSTNKIDNTYQCRRDS